jgi:hypothetical protein
MVPSSVSQAISLRLGPRGEADPTGGQRAIDGGAADVGWHPQPPGFEQHPLG